ncbi:DUF115 domain-containing protein [Rossellomorea aquimaris]|uniref:motility associated factor glycosyltransferase family protein n=1 Tax=Rossellomorea aquimaris TaxID=189382 RepID=UPI001CD7DE25|nr:6-hydroxymethylpterin diphosphokinase MptE-like protein [Rossellomorea aquimaris]MCA1061374.1 DUF115 domain-containing protein [Rossellomorea aquimaris]
MILIENRKYLNKHNRFLLDTLSKLEQNLEGSSNVQIEHTKSNVKTLKLNYNGKFLYLHSKYNPKAEVEKLLSRVKDLSAYKHVLFVGIGMGYHIEKLLSQYPEMKFSIYEPNKEILLHYFSNREINELPIKNLEKLLTSGEENQLQHELNLLDEHLKMSTYVYTLPVYEKVYSKELEIISTCFTNILKEKKSEISTNKAFQKRWTINAIKNFPCVSKTPNILHHIDKNIFIGKPAIIVAAGPSLDDEIENLKYIKKYGLAYIFSVGSAINTLINHGIHPDAACTYDPSEKNQVVMKSVKDLNISNIPLVFGSTVGYETLEGYPGPLLHMMTNQDTISPKLIDTSQDIDIVLDAPSIAVVTYQLLMSLGFSTIILVGQNLSYKENKRYSTGIQYNHISSDLTDQEVKESISVRGVDGNFVQTNETFVRMQKQLELYIKNAPNVLTINTSKGGAHIEGTVFMSLTEVILKNLRRSNIVTSSWYETKNEYDHSYIVNQLDSMERHITRLNKQINNSIKELKVIDFCVNKNQLQGLESKFVKFDKEFNKLKNNQFYQSFIEPMLRVQNKRLANDSKFIRFESKLDKKGMLVIQSFGMFLKDCMEHLEFILPLYYELKKNVHYQIKSKQKI